MGVWLASGFLIVESALLVVALGALALGILALPEGEIRTVVSCAILGGIGGCTYCLRSVYLSACVRKNWDAAWLPWYLIRPQVSILLGGVSYLFIKSGLLLLGAAQEPNASALGVWAIAFLAGLNVDRFLARVESVGHSVWGIDPSRQSKPAGDSTER